MGLNITPTISEHSNINAPPTKSTSFADQRAEQRSNFSCESFSLEGDRKGDGRSDCKSITVSFCDDASTKALAGSICYR